MSVTVFVVLFERMEDPLIPTGPRPEPCLAANPAEPEEVRVMQPRPKRRLPPGPYAKTSDGHPAEAMPAGPRPLPKTRPCGPPAAKTSGSPPVRDTVPLVKVEGASRATASGAALRDGGHAKAAPTLVKASQTGSFAGLFLMNVCMSLDIVE